MQTLEQMLLAWNASPALRVLVLLIGTVLLGTVLGRLIMRYGMQLARRTNTASDDFVVKLLATLLQYGTYIAGALSALATLGIDVTPLLTGAGFVGIIVGLAAQDTLGNMLAGIIIIVDRPFDVGDRILLPAALGEEYGQWGRVQTINLRTTRLLSTDGVLLSVPNRALVNSSIVNAEHTESGNLRVRLTISLHPQPANLRRGMAIIEQVLADTPLIEHAPRSPQVIVRDLKAHEARVEARYFVQQGYHVRLTRSQIYLDLLDRFSAENIQMAVPVSRNYSMPTPFIEPDPDLEPEVAEIATTYDDLNGHHDERRDLDAFEVGG